MLTWPTDFNDKCTDLSDIMAVLTPTTWWMYCTDLTTSWLYWPQQHSGCTDLNNILDVLTSTTFWMYWSRQHSGCTDLNNILDVLTSTTFWMYWLQQHSGRTDFNNILDVLISTTFWMYWLQHSGCTDLNDIYLLTLISCLGLLVFGISLSHSFDVDFADGCMLDDGLGVVAADDTASSFLHTAWRLPRLIDVQRREPAQFRQVLPARPLMATNKTDRVSACRHERKDVVLSQISCSSKLPYHSKFVSNWILTSFEPCRVT